ncbi:MAG: oxamate carbamoyltransferase subunit AllH family protein [Motilibacteraceae bacterium]
MHSGGNLAHRAGASDPVPVAASAQVAALIDGPARPVRVLGVFPQAAYLAVEGAARGRDVLALLAPGAVRQPIGVVLPATDTARCLDLLRADDLDVRVGEGRVELATTTLLPRRWWTARPSGPLRDGWRHLPLPPLPADVRSPAEHLATVLTTHVSGAEGLGRAVAALIGLGPGLTPAGDDLLCGALAGLRAASLPAAAPLADVVRRLAPVRTTRLSAALLVAAADGAVLPDLAALLSAPTPDRAAAALRQLLSVGHTSGACLAAGALLALRAAAVSDSPSEKTRWRTCGPAEPAPRREEAVA